MTTLKVEDIHKCFGANEVLKGVSLTATSGDVISLIGSSGSGKSTFLRCINMLEQPNKGAIELDGQKIEMTLNPSGCLIPKSRKELQKLRTTLAMVFQSFNLWAHMTVLENILVAPMRVQGLNRKEATDKAFHYLRKVHIDPERFGNSYPAHLSGGQQQRVAIARALAVEPEIILFDEPTSALDPELVGEVLGVIKGLAAEGRTMIMVTHEMAFAREVSTKAIFLHQGRIEEQGTPEQMFRAPTSERLQTFLSGALK